MLFCNLQLAIKKPYWYEAKSGQIGQDFRSKHTILLLHVWMVHKRLLKMGERGQDIQVCLVRLMALRVEVSCFSRDFVLSTPLFP